MGRMAATKMGATSIGNKTSGKSIELWRVASWRISGIFSAGGSAFESEAWCRLDELQQAMKRQDLSIVALALTPRLLTFPIWTCFAKNGLIWNCRQSGKPDYYASLQKDYGPIRWLAWLVVLLVAGAGVFAGLEHPLWIGCGSNSGTLHLAGAGFCSTCDCGEPDSGRRVNAGMPPPALLAALVALVFVNDAAVRFTMGAFALRIDSTGSFDRLWSWSVDGIARRNSSSYPGTYECPSSMG